MPSRTSWRGELYNWAVNKRTRPSIPTQPSSSPPTKQVNERCLETRRHGSTSEIIPTTQSIRRTKRFPARAKPPNPSTVWENLVADSEARQCHTHARPVHCKGRPARSQCAHARWGRPNSSSTLPPPVPSGGPAVQCAQISPDCSQHPGTTKALKDGTEPLITSLARRGPAPQIQPLWAA